MHLDAGAPIGLQTWSRSHFLGYAHQTGAAAKGEISMPALAEATVTNGAIALGLCPAPEYFFAYPTICPLILLDEILIDLGCFGIRGRRGIIAHFRLLPKVASNDTMPSVYARDRCIPRRLRSELVPGFNRN
jgi:hypothetical protein